MPSQNDSPVVIGRRFVSSVVFSALAGVCLVMGGCPYYNVYHQHMEGKAQLAKAEYSKQVMVLDAKAREDSAASLAKAEITRAEGVAKANKIIGDSLNNNESYLHYLWLHGLEAGNNDVIYVATEAGMPIFEAGSRLNRTKRSPRQPGDPGTIEHPDATTEYPRKPSTP